ncbi:MAG: hypothetical protein H0U23_04340 [Blastocatellia bacterium]|nr:hypothetical protein [Blastocatellia bacterium]
MRSERELHDQFSAWLRKNGYAWFHSRMDKPTSMTCGDPDFAVFRDTGVAFFEMKVGRNKLSRAQEKRVAELEAAGCPVFVVRTLEDAIGHVERIWGPEAATEAPAKPVAPASEKLYAASSRDLGDIVVRGIGQDGKIMEFVRLAGKTDRMLPRWA